MGKRILKGEKEAAAKKAAENPEAVAESVEGPQEEVPKLIQNEKREPAVDNRKLIYEDIWDDVPATSSSAGPVPSQASAKHNATSSSAFSPAASFEGSRPGWYFGMGDRGLGYYRDTQRSVTQESQETSSTKSTAAEPKQTKKSWYSEMQANIKAKEEAIDRGIREGRSEREQRKAWLNAAAKGASFEVPHATIPSEAASKDETRQPFAPPPRR